MVDLINGSRAKARLIRRLGWCLTMTTTTMGWLMRRIFPEDPRDFADADGDGVGDNADAYPDDPSQQFLNFSEALAGIVDAQLASCIREQNQDAETVTSVTRVDCNDRDNRVESLSGNRSVF